MTGGSFVLQVVVENGFLDLFEIDKKIRPLSKEFQVIGMQAMEEHSVYLQTLTEINSDFKFHFCSLCEKPHVADGSWKANDLCCCDLDETLHAQEISRRIRLRAVGDPRLDPSFASHSTKTKVLRMAPFTTWFSSRAMECIGHSGWLYRMTTLFPLIPLNLAPLIEWNRIALDFLAICIYIDMLRKEFFSVRPRSTTLLDLVLQLLENPSEQACFNELSTSDQASIAMFFGGREKLNGFVRSALKSFFKILSLHAADGHPLDDLKNLGNSIGMFLANHENNAHYFLPPAFLAAMLFRLPETFVWMPIYGGSPEDYVPPVNQFALFSAQD